MFFKNVIEVFKVLILVEKIIGFVIVMISGDIFIFLRKFMIFLKFFCKLICFLNFLVEWRIKFRIVFFFLRFLFVNFDCNFLCELSKREIIFKDFFLSGKLRSRGLFEMIFLMIFFVILVDVSLWIFFWILFWLRLKIYGVLNIKVMIL